MDRVLSSPELLDIIFAYTDKATDVSCTTVNRNFFEAATKQIWFRVEKLDHIFSVLAPIVKTHVSNQNWTATAIQRFSRIPMLSDWNRFYSYAPKIRVLKVDAEAQNLHYIFQEIGLSRTQLQLFPKLSSIDIAITPLSVDIIALLVQENLQKIIIRVESAKGTHLLSSFLAILSERASNITEVYLQGDIRAKGSEKDLAKFFGSQRSLRSVILPLYTNSSSIMSSLAPLPKLTSIDFRYYDFEFKPWGKGNRADILKISPSLSALSFLNLDSLSMAITIEDITCFFSMKYAPANITTLSFHVVNQYSVDSITRCLTLLARTCPMMNEFALDLKSDSVADLESATAVDFEWFRPLLALKNMLFFTIHHCKPLPWTSEDLTLVLKSWPDIQILKLNPEPLILGDPYLHISCLDIFSRLSPVCMELGLYVDTCLANDFLESSPMGILEVNHFRFGASPIENAEDVAIYLGLMSLSSFTLDTKIRLTREMREAMSRQDSASRFEYAETWNKVIDLLPMVSKISKKYRSEINKLGKKIYDLEEQ